MAKTENKQTAPTEKKKSFLQNIGFLEEKTTDKSENKSSATNEASSSTSFVFDFSEAATQQETAKSEPIIQPTKQAQSTSSISVIDPKIAERLKKVLTDNNFPGPDYFEYKQQLDILNELIPDETTRYKAAYKSLINQGVTKEKITDSAGKYVNILLSENTKFSEAISQKSGTDIEFKTQEAKVLNTENISIQRQIDELKLKIEGNTQRIKVLGTEVQKAQTEITDAKKRFENTLNVFVNEIKTNSEKVEIYIKE